MDGRRREWLKVLVFCFDELILVLVHKRLSYIHN